MLSKLFSEVELAMSTSHQLLKKREKNEGALKPMKPVENLQNPQDPSILISFESK